MQIDIIYAREMNLCDFEISFWWASMIFLEINSLSLERFILYKNISSFVHIMSRVVTIDNVVYIDIYIFFYHSEWNHARRRSSLKLRCYVLSADYLRVHVLTHALNAAWARESVQWLSINCNMYCQLFKIFWISSNTLIKDLSNIMLSYFHGERTRILKLI